MASKKDGGKVVIKYRDPVISSFSNKDIVLNSNTGTIFYKKGKKLFSFRGAEALADLVVFPGEAENTQILFHDRTDNGGVNESPIMQGSPNFIYKPASQTCDCFDTFQIAANTKTVFSGSMTIGEHLPASCLHLGLHPYNDLNLALLVSGNLMVAANSSSGMVGDITASRNIYAQGDLWGTNAYISDALLHRGNTNTKLSFSTNTINLYSGGGNIATVSTDRFTVNGSNDLYIPGTDVVPAASSSTGTSVLVVDTSNGRVYRTGSFPGETFKQTGQRDGDSAITGSLTVLGTLRANAYIVTESVTHVDFSSGSTMFGNSSDDTHTFTGSVTTSRDMNVGRYLYSDATQATTTEKIAMYNTTTGRYYYTASDAFAHFGAYPWSLHYTGSLVSTDVQQLNFIGNAVTMSSANAGGGVTASINIEPAIYDYLLWHDGRPNYISSSQHVAISKSLYVGALPPSQQHTATSSLLHVSGGAGEQNGTQTEILLETSATSGSVAYRIKNQNQNYSFGINETGSTHEGSGSFMLTNITEGSTPFVVEKGAFTHTLYIGSGSNEFNTDLNPNYAKPGGGKMGFVGINTDNPEAALDIRGRLKIQGGSSGFDRDTILQRPNTPQGGIHLVPASANGTAITFGGPGLGGGQSASAGIYAHNNETQGTSLAFGVSRTANHVAGTGSISAMRITEDGRIGIGTTVPSFDFELHRGNYRHTPTEFHPYRSATMRLLSPSQSLFWAQASPSSGSEFQTGEVKAIFGGYITGSQQSGSIAKALLTTRPELAENNKAVSIYFPSEDDQTGEGVGIGIPFLTIPKAKLHVSGTHYQQGDLIHRGLRDDGNLEYYSIESKLLDHPSYPYWNRYRPSFRGTTVLHTQSFHAYTHSLGGPHCSKQHKWNNRPASITSSGFLFIEQSASFGAIKPAAHHMIEVETGNTSSFHYDGKQITGSNTSYTASFHVGSAIRIRHWADKSPLSYTTVFNTSITASANMSHSIFGYAIGAKAGRGDFIRIVSGTFSSIHEITGSGYGTSDTDRLDFLPKYEGGATHSLQVYKLEKRFDQIENIAGISGNLSMSLSNPWEGISTTLMTSGSVGMPVSMSTGITFLPRIFVDPDLLVVKSSADAPKFVVNRSGSISASGYIQAGLQLSPNTDNVVMYQQPNGKFYYTSSAALFNTADTFKITGQRDGDSSITGSLILSGSGTTELEVVGNISASGTVIANEVSVFGHITASGNISASGYVSSSRLSVVKSKGQGTPNPGTSDIATFQNNDNSQDASIAIIAADTHRSQLHFGKHDDIDIGSIKYFHDGHTTSPDQFKFKVNGTNVVTFNNISNKGRIGVGLDFTPTDYFHAQGALTGGGLTISSSNGGTILLKAANTRAILDRTATNKKLNIEFNTAGTTNWTLGNIAESNDNFYIYSGDATSDKHISLTSDSTTFHTNVTASGDLSASGIIESSEFKLHRNGYDHYRLRQSSGTGLEFYNTTDANVTLKLDSGKVGIGTTVPGEALEVVGNISASGNLHSSSSLGLQNIATYNSESGQYFYTSSAGLSAQLDTFKQTGLRTGFAYIDGNITASNNISASGHLITSASEGKGTDTIVMYDTGSGQYYYTSSLYGVPGLNIVVSATSASYAISASGAIYALNAVTASHAISASGAIYALNAVTASHAISASGAIHAISASYANSASGAIYALNAVTASHANIADLALNATSASYAISASGAIYALNAVTASHAISASGAIYALNAVTASHSLTIPLDISVRHVTASGNISASGDGYFTGKVGIGTTAPESSLHVYNGYLQVEPVTFAGNQDEWVLKINAYDNSGWDDDAGIKYKSDGSGNPILAFNQSGATRMAIKSGKVGIGTTAPSQKLTVTGNISASGFISTTSHITASGNISASGTIHAAGGTMSDNITFDTTKGIFFVDSGTKIIGNASNMTIDGDSSVNILGDTSVVVTSPSLFATGHITASGNISASGFLLISASEGISNNTDTILMYDSSSGQVYYTSSFNFDPSSGAMTEVEFDLTSGYNGIVTGDTTIDDASGPKAGFDFRAGKNIELVGWSGGDRITFNTLDSPLFNSASITGSLYVGGGNGPGHITASGNISASGNIYGIIGTATQGTIDHDSLANFVANEHIDWTANQGGTNIHTGNYTNTVDMGSGFVLEDDDGTEVTITENKEVKFITSGNGLDCDWTDTSNGSNSDPYDMTWKLDIPGITTSAPAISAANETEGNIDIVVDANGTLQQMTLAQLGEYLVESGSYVGEVNSIEIEVDGLAVPDDGGRKAKFDFDSGNYMALVATPGSNKIVWNFAPGGAHAGVHTNNPGASTMASPNSNLTYNSGSTGQLRCAGDIVAYASDKRLKENIVEIPDAIEKIKQLRGVTYDWKDLTLDLGFQTDRQYNEVGLIAQELEKVLPQAVTKAPFDNESNPKMYYSGSRIDGETEPYKTVKMDKVVPLLIEGIKDQQKQIDELKELVTKLINNCD